MDIPYCKISEENFLPTSLDGFISHQEVRECWRKADGQWKLLPIAYTDDSGPDAQTILAALRAGNPAFGAWLGGELAGFALLAKERFGSEAQYIGLTEFYVSQPCRRQGIGEKLFALACQGARELGASKLYISAHSARESIAAYRKYGCVEAREVNQFLAEKEPCDMQLEFQL